MDRQIVDPNPGKNYNVAISAGDPHFEMEKIEITLWKMRAYDFYSRVEEYQKTNE